MSNSFSSNDDIIDIRDIIARVEELREPREALREEFEDEPANEGVDFDGWVCNQVGFTREDQTELTLLEELLAELAGTGGDERWEGDWYPVTLIRDSHFNDAMDELIADCYTLPELPSFMTVTLDYVALQMDYTSVEFEGVTYWVR